MIFSNLFTPVHLYYRPQIKRIHVFKRIFRRGLEKFCQVIFCCRHFHCVRIEPTRKRRCIEFLTTQTDQSKCDILIDYVLNIALKHIIWRFQICNYFRDFMNTLRNFAESVFACIFEKFTYIAKQFILTESPDHVL